MTLDAYTSGRDLRREADAVFDAVCDDLQMAHERAWGDARAGEAPSLQIPAAALGTLGSSPGLPRQWAVAEDLGGKRLVYRSRHLPRHSQPTFHPAVARLSREDAFISGIEVAVVELGHRLEPWFGAPPVSFDWVVTMVGPPAVTQLGYWLSTVRYSLDDVVTDERLASALARRAGLPIFWAETAADAIKWELAVARGLTVPGSYSPPAATRDRPFAEFRNPFAVVLDIWRAGAMIESTLSGDTATVCVDARSIPSV